MRLNQPERAFVPVRKSGDDGHELILLGEIRHLREQCEGAVAAIRGAIPKWDATNPVLRIAEVTITVVWDDWQEWELRHETKR